MTPKHEQPAVSPGVVAESVSMLAPTVPADTVALIILERSDHLSHELLHQRVVSSLPQLARFRSVLVDKPLGLGHPMWAEFDGYDPTGQIYSATVGAPGDARELAALITEINAEHLDRRKPLWQAWSIDGLAGDRWALAVRTSPALSEEAASIWPRLLDSQMRARATLANEPSLDISSSLVALVSDLMIDIVEAQFTGLWSIAEAAVGWLQTVHNRMRGIDVVDPVPPPVTSMRGPVPHNAFNAPLTDRRTVAFGSIPLPQLETVKKAFGGSIGNVVLAACTLSLRGWLQRHDRVPDDPLSMQMPLTYAADDHSLGTTFAVGQIRIPVQLDDPVQILTNLHTATERLTKQSALEKFIPAVDFTTLVSLVPPMIAREGKRLCARLGLLERFGSISHGSLSYISGTTARTYCAGTEVVGMHTIAPLAAGGVNITLTLRGGAVDVTVNACPDNVPEVGEIATGIVESVRTLVTAAQQSPRGQGRSVVTEMSSHTRFRREQ